VCHGCMQACNLMADRPEKAIREQGLIDDLNHSRPRASAERRALNLGMIQSLQYTSMDEIRSSDRSCHGGHLLPCSPRYVKDVMHRLRRTALLCRRTNCEMSVWYRETGLQPVHGPLLPAGNAGTDSAGHALCRSQNAGSASDPGHPAPDSFPTLC
jgi:hypothetical protein